LAVPDQRSKGQRYADALGLVAKLALAAVGSGARSTGRGSSSTHRCTAGAESEQTGPISEPWLARHLCDAVLQAALIGDNGQVLNLAGCSGRSPPASGGH
jgi:hypothetical protein